MSIYKKTEISYVQGAEGDLGGLGLQGEFLLPESSMALLLHGVTMCV